MHIIAEPGCNVFKLVALFPIGRSCETKHGLVQSVAAMLKKATDKKTNKVLHEFLDRYSIQIEIYSTPTHLTAQMHCHKRFLEKAVPIFFEILFRAKFSYKNWQLAKRQTIDSIEQQMMQTDFWAEKMLTEHLLGEDHPYGYYSTPQNYYGIQIDEIKTFYHLYVSKIKPEFFIAGDDTNIAKKIIEGELKNYKLISKNTVKAPSIKNALPSKLEKRILGSSQASVRLGKVIEKKSFKDFQKLELLNMFLGGYYTSELMKLLRIELGLTYGVYSHLHHFPEFSVFYIGFEMDKKNVPVALEAITKLFERLSKENMIEISEAAKEYYSQWSKNSEKSLQEIMYKARMYKLQYDYEEYESWTKGLENFRKSKTISIDSSIFDFSTYSKSIAY
jgi:predicted Zn-dependent peptidase